MTTDTQRLDWMEADPCNFLAVHFQSSLTDASIREIVDYLMKFETPLDAPPFTRETADK